MKGFTLIETVIYIALFALIIGGAVETGYQLMLASGADSARAQLQSEGAFVQAKIGWTFMNLAHVPTLAGSGCDQSITVQKLGGQGSVAIRLAEGAVEMSEGGAFEPLTDVRTSATCLTFEVIPFGSAHPSEIRAEATIGGRVFVIERSFEQS